MPGHEGRYWGGTPGQSEYQHDSLTFDELADLLGGVPDAPVVTRLETSASGPSTAQVVANQPSVEVALPDPQGQPSKEQAESLGLSVDESASDSKLETIDPQLSSEAPAEVSPPNAVEELAHELLFLLEPQQETPQSAPTVDFDVPDLLGADIPETDQDLLPEVDTDLRARQLATAFLIEQGELTRHVSLVVDIILARKWSTAQLKVRELLACGHGLPEIYRAFMVSEAWRQCDVLDERIGESMNGRWMHSASPRLSWLESVRLVAFFEDDATVDEIIQFAESERHAWRLSSRLRNLYPRFKSYLLEHRLSEESRRPSVGWYRTLAPHDDRDFSGNTNPEYTPEWWEDETPSAVSRLALMQRIYRGDPFDMLVPDDDEDNLNWVEDL